MYSNEDQIRKGTARRFDFGTWWKDQSAVTVFHGTSLKNLLSILMDGELRPSEKGYTRGKLFFTTGPRQAWNYSVMGGEVDARGQARLSGDERVMLVLSIRPELLVPEGKCNPEQFAQIVELLEEDPGFREYFEGTGINFAADRAITADCIVEVFRLE